MTSFGVLLLLGAGRQKRSVPGGNGVDPTPRLPELSLLRAT